ncbi:MAG: hypothetical protein IKK84_00145 [Clostridia bacterium]|nr:hypothetical protein [Clostridia bacterium]
MKKVIKYDGTKTFMYPNGAIATKERVLQDFPAALTFTHIIETDEAEEVCFAVQNLSAMRGIYNVDTSLTEEEAITKIEEIINTVPEQEVSAEERIASALEYQNLMSMEDVEV